MTKPVIDHRKLMASLSREQQGALTAKSDWAGLVHLAIHALALTVTATLIQLAVPLWQLLLPVHGILLVFLFTTLHETIHKTAFATGWINDAVARICGFLIVLPPNWFRYFHFAHHRHTNDPDHDPELASPKPQLLAAYALNVSGFPVWVFHVKTLFRNAFGKCNDRFVPKRGLAKVKTEAQIMLTLYALFAVGSVAFANPVLLWLWVLPAILGQPFLRLYLMAEHGRCPPVANMFENSRTTFTNTVMRRLAWNMPYHAEHHANPVVPFHKLPDFHELAKAHLKQTENGYVRFQAKTIRGFQGAQK